MTTCDFCGRPVERKPGSRGPAPKYHPNCKQAAYRRRVNPDTGSPEAKARQREGLEASQVTADLHEAGLMIDGSVQELPPRRQRDVEEAPQQELVRLAAEGDGFHFTGVERADGWDPDAGWREDPRPLWEQLLFEAKPVYHGNENDRRRNAKRGPAAITVNPGKGVPMETRPILIPSKRTDPPTYVGNGAYFDSPQRLMSFVDWRKWAEACHRLARLEEAAGEPTEKTSNGSVTFDPDAERWEWIDGTLTCLTGAWRRTDITTAAEEAPMQHVTIPDRVESVEDRLARLEEMFRETMEGIAVAAQKLAARIPEDERIAGAVDALLADVEQRGAHREDLASPKDIEAFRRSMGR